MRIVPVIVRRVVREQRGLTIVEGVVAAMLVVIGALGVFTVFDAGARNTLRAEQSQVLSNRLQSELEKIRALPYAQVAMTANPGAVSDQDDPRSRVTEAGGFILARGGQQSLPMAVNGGTKPGSGTVSGGTVDPGPTPFESGDVSGKLYRFVVWDSDPSCAANTCSDLKQVVVVAVVDDTAVTFSRPYQELHTQVSNPDAINGNQPPPTQNPTRTAQFWLTHTPCGSPDTRQIPVDSPTHNTRGLCDSSPPPQSTTGSTRGAPDLMFTEAPALDEFGQAPTPASYSTDVPPPGPGLVMRPQAANGCLLSYLAVGPLGFSGPLDLDLLQLSGDHETLHKWVTPPMQGSTNILVSGRATLQLWTRTANETDDTPGRICVWLFRRTGEVNGLPVDLPLVSVPPASQYSCPSPPGQPEPCDENWPTNWRDIPVPMDFIDVLLKPGDRLGLAITVEQQGSAGNKLRFMYDHPDFDSRLEVQTQQLLPF